MLNPQEIGERLLITRRRHALTQKELAEQAGLSELTILRIERGNFTEAPRPATVRGIADALGVDPGWLLFGNDTAESGR